MSAIPYIRNGVEVTREEFDRTIRKAPSRRKRKKNRKFPNIASAYGEGKPWRSLSISCHPDQIPERNALLKARNITGAYYDPAQPIDNFVATSQKGRREAMKLFGVHDADGGYGDG
jgi:hypothetical protein